MGSNVTFSMVQTLPITILPSSTLSSEKVAYCERTMCGDNSECVPTNLYDGYCTCVAGYFGNPLEKCSAEIGENFVVIPQSLELQVTYSDELQDIKSDKFRKYKTAFEKILDSSFKDITFYIPGSAQVNNFK